MLNILRIRRLFFFKKPSASLDVIFLYVFCVGILSSGCTGSKGSGSITAKYDEASQNSFKGIHSITNVTDSTITINWIPNESAKSYLIFDVTNDANTLIQTINDKSQSDFQITGLTPNTVYSYNVKMVGPSNELDENLESISIITNSAPNAPTAPTFHTPQKSPGYEKDVILTIDGIKNGDTVKVFSDETCSTLLDSIEVTTDTTSIDIALSSSLTPQTYHFYANATNSQGSASECSEGLAYIFDTCPEGYILVPKNMDQQIHAFCVMKYEAKAQLMNAGVADAVETTGGASAGWATVYHPTNQTTGYRPISQPEDTPWRYVSPVDAKQACLNLGEGYDLISNAEWMTIALNIEAQASNWSGGSVGSGCVSRGNSGEDTVCSFNGANPGSGATRDDLVKLTLSNTEVIWDFAGNNWEWVDWAHPSLSGTTGADFLIGPTDCENPLLDSIEIPDNTCTSLLDHEYLPANPASPPVAIADYNSDYGLGTIFFGNGGAALRGGGWFHLADTGIFSLKLDFNTGSQTSANFSFRCVKR